MSKNKSGSKLGVLPRVGVLSRDSVFFRRSDITLDTHALPARVASRGHCIRRAFCPNVIPWLSRARRILRISIRITFEPRTDFTYCVISGFDMLEPLDRFQFNIC
ncbi:hypothetical protein ACE6H2_006218 [Prunus campanulata]